MTTPHPNDFAADLEFPDGRILAPVSGRIWLVRRFDSLSGEEYRSIRGWFIAPEPLWPGDLRKRFTLSIPGTGSVPILLTLVGGSRAEFESVGPPEWAEGGRPIAELNWTGTEDVP
jgi:hypothetical protein